MAAAIYLIYFLNSLSHAAVLFLICSGITLIYGVMRILNLSHGSLYSMGAFVAAWVVGVASTVQGLLLFPLLLLGAVVMAAVGAVIEPIFLRPLYKRDEEYQLLMTFGLLYILSNLELVIWGPNPLYAAGPWNYLGTIDLLGQDYPGYNLFVIAVGFVTVPILWAFVYRTRFGLILRATSMDRNTASALGVNVKRVFTGAFVIGAFLAGLGGSIIVPAQSAFLDLGLDALVLAFVVLIIGGLGSIEGALVGSVIVGFLRTILLAVYPPIELSILYLIMVAILLIRPRGLFGKD